MQIYKILLHLCTLGKNMKKCATLRKLHYLSLHFLKFIGMQWLRRGLLTSEDFFFQKSLIFYHFFNPLCCIHTHSVICMLYSGEPNMHIWWRVLTFDAIFTFCDIRSCKFKCHVKVWTYLPHFSKSFWIFSPFDYVYK